MKSSHCISIKDNLGEFLPGVCVDSHDVARRWKGKNPPPDRFLQGEGVGLYLKQPSLRTRVSITQATGSLGGILNDLSASQILHYSDGTERETPQEVAEQLRALHIRIICMRLENHEAIRRLADAADPDDLVVINSLSRHGHPTQAVADMALLHEKLGRLKSRKLTYVGDANNTARSLMEAAALSGMHFVHTGPDIQKYCFSRDEISETDALARENGGSVRFVEDPIEGVSDANAVYTDVWASMGQEAEKTGRIQAFHGYQVNEKLMSKAKEHAGFMHCLPATPARLEVAENVLHSPYSWVNEQGAYRLYTLEPLWARLTGNGKQ